MAEHTIALLMELARQVGKLDRQVKTGDWDGADGYELYGKKLGIIGLGGIGQTVARIAGALGMNVSAWNSHVPEQVFADLNITPVNDMNELIAGSDVVSIHMPLLDSTKGIVTAENLEALKPGTMFINTARAEIIEPGALLARLQRGDIPAALDVFEHELSLPTIRSVRFQASSSPRTPRGAPMAPMWASPDRWSNPLRHSARARISTSPCE